MPDPDRASVLRCSGSLLLLLQCRLESAETERHRGLDEPTSPFSPADAGLTSADNARHAASRHRPLRVAPAHFRFRTRARTAAATGLPSLLRPGAAWLSSCCGGREPLLLSFRPKYSVISSIPSSVISSAVEKSQSRRNLPAAVQQPAHTQTLTKYQLEGPRKKQATFQTWFCKQQSFNHLRNRSWKVACVVLKRVYPIKCKARF